MPEKLTEKIMQEIGLEADQDNCIVDQDTGIQLQFNGKKIKYDKNIHMGKEICFDPVENTKLMHHLFSYYVDKVHNEGGRYINIYYPVEGQTPNKGSIELKDDQNNKMRSAEYYNDSLKYADLIFQLNGETDVNLSEYDKERPR